MAVQRTAQTFGGTSTAFRAAAVGDMSIALRKAVLGDMSIELRTAALGDMSIALRTAVLGNMSISLRTAVLGDMSIVLRTAALGDMSIALRTAALANSNVYATYLQHTKTHRKTRPTGWHAWFIFWRSRNQISLQRTFTYTQDLPSCSSDPRGEGRLVHQTRT